MGAVKGMCGWMRVIVSGKYNRTQGSFQTVDHFSTGNFWQESYRENWASQRQKDGELPQSKAADVQSVWSSAPKCELNTILHKHTHTHTQLENRRYSEKSQLPLRYNCLFYFYIWNNKNHVSRYTTLPVLTCMFQTRLSVCILVVVILQWHFP